MKNILKIGLVVLTSVAMNSISFAGELTVTGSANARYQIMSSDSTNAANNLDKGLGVTNEFDLGASGELDNGMTWNYQLQIDPGEVSATAGQLDYDDAQLTLTTDYGTVGAFISEGSLGVKYSSWDPSAYGVASDTGNGFGMKYAPNIGAYDNLQYHLPADMLPMSTTVKLAYSPACNAKYSSGGTAALTTTTRDCSQYQVTTQPVDGLTLSADYMEFSDDRGVGASSREGGSYGAKYAIGAVTVGYGKSFENSGVLGTATYAAAKDTALANYESIENTAYGIGFKVNDDLSVSYTSEESNPDAATASVATYTMTIESMQAAYTMGGMTLSISHDTAENSDYIQDQKEKETLFAVGMAF